MTSHGDKDMYLSELTAQWFNLQRLRSKASPIHPSFRLNHVLDFFHPSPSQVRLVRGGLPSETLKSGSLEGGQPAGSAKGTILRVSTP